MCGSGLLKFSLAVCLHHAFWFQWLVSSFVPLLRVEKGSHEVDPMENVWFSRWVMLEEVSPAPGRS